MKDQLHITQYFIIEEVKVAVVYVCKQIRIKWFD